MTVILLDLGIIEWGILGVPLNEHGYQTCGSIGESELLTLCSIGQVVMYKALLMIINRKKWGSTFLQAYKILVHFPIGNYIEDNGYVDSLACRVGPGWPGSVTV